MDLDDVHRYVELRRRQSELESEASGVKEEADQIEQRLLEDFAEQGVDRMSVNGHTVYLHRQLWARVPEGVTRAEVVEALEEAGLGHFVRRQYNTQTVSAWLRDLEREEEELPPELYGMIEGSERYSLRVRRA